MSTIQVSYTIAMAAAQDAGDRHMRAAGRKTWDGSDYDEAAATFARIYALNHNEEN